MSQNNFSQRWTRVPHPYSSKICLQVYRIASVYRAVVSHSGPISHSSSFKIFPGPFVHNRRDQGLHQSKRDHHNHSTCWQAISYALLPHSTFTGACRTFLIRPALSTAPIFTVICGLPLYPPSHCHTLYLGLFGSCSFVSDLSEPICKFIHHVRL